MNERPRAGVDPADFDLLIYRDCAFTWPFELALTDEETGEETPEPWGPDTFFVARFPRDGERWYADITDDEAVFNIPATQANERQGGEVVEWVVEYLGQDQNPVAVGFVIRQG